MNMNKLLLEINLKFYFSNKIFNNLIGPLQSLKIFSEQWDDHRVSRKLGDGLEVFGNATMVDDERIFSGIASWFSSAISDVASAFDDLGSAFEDLGGIPCYLFKRFKRRQIDGDQ